MNDVINAAWYWEITQQLGTDLYGEVVLDL